MRAFTIFFDRTPPGGRGRASTSHPYALPFRFAYNTIFSRVRTKRLTKRDLEYKNFANEIMSYSGVVASAGLEPATFAVTGYALPLSYDATW